MWTEKDEKLFMNTFESIRIQLKNDLRTKSTYFESILDEAVVYNVPHGKRTRGITVIEAYRTLTESTDEANIEMSRVVGWCVELLQGGLLMADDIVDQSLTRRNQKCWYLHSPRRAPIHANCMFSALYFLLKTNCKHHRNYVKLLETFMEIEHCTEIGQCIDAKSECNKKPDALNTFTRSRSAMIARMKTAYYTTVLPAKLALYLANIDDPETHTKAESILLDIGVLFQAQDDFLDMYGDPKITGKIGTDIQDGKCSWLAAEALARMDDQQRQIFKENYGKNDKAAVKIIKNIYKELNLKKAFEEFEDIEYKAIVTNIEQFQTSIPHLKTVLLFMLNTYYKRKK